MALETSPPVKRAGWRRQASQGLREGSKRRLQWRQVRQEEEGAAGEEQGELVEVDVEATSTSSIVRSRAARGEGARRHRLCSSEEQEVSSPEAAEVANCEREREPATERIRKGMLATSR